MWQFDAILLSFILSYRPTAVKTLLRKKAGDAPASPGHRFNYAISGSAILSSLLIRKTAKPVIATTVR